MATQEISYIIRARDAYSNIHKAADSAVDQTAKNLAKASAVMTVAVAGVSASIFAMTKSTADSGDEFQKMSARLGISSQALSEMKHATELSGASLQSYELGLRKLSRGAVEADRGLATYKRTFDELGIAVRDSNGQMKNSDALFMEVVEGLNNVESSTRKTALAQELLGRSGTMLLPLINAGSEGLKEMRQEAVDLGITFDEVAADESAAFVDAMLRVKGSAVGFKNTFSKEIMPFFTTAMDELAAAFIDFKKTGDLDVWAANVSEGVITAFSAVAEVGTNVPLIWQASMVSVKTVSAEAIAIIDTVLIGAEKMFGILAKLPGDIGLPYKQASQDINDMRSNLSDIGTELLVSADASSKAGEEWGVWQAKALSAIDSVRLKSKEKGIATPGAEEAVEAEEETPLVVLAEKEANKIISIQQEKFRRLHEMTIEADLNEREMSALKLQRELEEMEADRIRLEENHLLNTELKDQFRIAEEEAHLLHQLRLTEINTTEEAKRLAEVEKTEKMIADAKQKGFGMASQFMNNIMAATNSHSKGMFKIMKAFAIAQAVVDGKAAAVGAYKIGASIGGPPLGAAFAAAAVAATGAQIAKINATQMAAGGGSAAGAGATTTPAITPPGTEEGTTLLSTRQEEARPTQEVNIIIKGEVVTAETIGKLSEPIFDMINKAGKEQDLKITVDALDVEAA